MPERVAFVLVDGVGDVAIPRLGNLTPLEAASVPNLDAIAAGGVNGLMDPVEPGLACGSDTAHLSILGYNPRIYYRGRGAFESMGAGLAMSPGDIAFKSNFATVDEQTGVVVKRRADRHFEQLGPILCGDLDGLQLPSFPGYTVSLKYATEHRCGVVVRGPGLSGNISGTDPLKDNRLLLDAKPLDETEDAKRTAEIVNEVSNEIRKRLRGHWINAQREREGKNPANVVLLRGCGIRIKVPSFASKNAMRACMVAPTKIIAGLGLSVGIDVLDVPEATGDYRTLLTAKALAIGRALTCDQPAGKKKDDETGEGRAVPVGEESMRPGDAVEGGGYDFGFLHIKAIDDAGHDKLPLLKVRGLQAVDHMIGQLGRILWEAEREGRGKYTLVVTGDHSTPVEYGDHSHEPVPVAVCHLADYVQACGGDEAVMAVNLDPFPIPQDTGNGQSGSIERGFESLDSKDKIRQGVGNQAPVPIAAGAGDCVAAYTETASAQGLLGRFPGSELMTIIQQFAGVVVA
ncbi:hypothetical protein CBR_g48938 [Chara braunii]|uniref:Metalloenzyme domain-containing protein n=1 Tax=Chara braunii TaxID=69332 RepID=A0A388M3R6_CHABU|nr:hypothetical protein CBR_g48938 [Chara braunii]|eukprot:GBG89230.1 hypothetical protein CBR_g48938 [Chara braunii]